MSNRLVYDVATGERSTVPLTRAEETERAVMAAAEQAEQAEQQAAAEANRQALTAVSDAPTWEQAKPVLLEWMRTRR